MKITFQSSNQGNGKIMKNIRKIHSNRGFTLIELLVVISIIGILMGIIGPKVFDLLSGSKATKTQATFQGWATQLIQYKEHYKYFPPFLLEEEEGVPSNLADDEVHENFIAALRGMAWDPESFSWEALSDELLKQNRKSREFHLFTEDEFGNIDQDDDSNDGKFLADSWGGRKIQIVVDQDGDGIIRLAESTASEIIESLKVEYDASVVEANKEKIKVIRGKVGIFVLFDDEGDSDTQNVFSWNIKKYLGVE